MIESVNHNQHYFKKFSEHLKEKDSKVHIAIGVNQTGHPTICVSDNLTHDEAIRLLESMAYKLRQMKN